jgi:beta-propeller repeat-containing protein
MRESAILASAGAWAKGNYGLGSTTVRRTRLLAALAAFGLLALALALLPRSGSPTDLGRPNAGDGSAAVPLALVPNRGQVDPSVRYYAQGPGYGFYFTRDDVVLSFRKGERGQALHLRFPGAGAHTAIAPQRRARGTVNYLRGDDPSKWQTGLPTYERVAYRGLWPGVDMSFHGAGGTLKYEFRLAAGASPDRIRLAYAGAEGLAMSRDGSLLIRTPLGTLRDQAPTAWQWIGGRKVPVESRYAINGRSHAYGFELGAYDRSRPLVIDPGLVYSTYLGGTGTDIPNALAVDETGNAYITGRTSASFPTTAGAFDTGLSGGSDAFVTKLDPDGSNLVYSTYLGGNGLDEGWGITVDGSGNAYASGQTSSTDFPTTVGAFDTTRDGSDDGFVTKLAADGSALVYSTYLGGSGNADYANAVAVDGSGSAYLTGYTVSSNFPTTPGAFDTNFMPAGDFEGFVTKLAPDGSALDYSTFLGGPNGTDTGNDITVDGSGSAYVVGSTLSSGFPTTPGAYDTTRSGQDAFVTKVDPSGSALTYSTLVGGTDIDGAASVAIDGGGSVYITGFTNNTDFPTTAGAFDTSYNSDGDAFVTKLNPTGSALTYSTFLGGTGAGGTGYDSGSGIAVDGSGRAYVTGRTDSLFFPTTPAAYDTIYSPVGDAFATQLNASGSALNYSSYLGGTGTEQGSDIAISGPGNAYIAGYTTSTSFPTSSGAFDSSSNGGYDGFVTKLLMDLYEHPIGASPLRVSLVPAFNRCEAAGVNSRHGEPLDFGACNPPQPISSTAYLGRGSIGLASWIVCNQASPAASCSQSGLVRPDVRLFANLRDVRCVGSVPSGCTTGGDYDPNGAGPYASMCTTAAECNTGAVKAEPYCAQSGTSQSDCIAGTDLTETAQIPGAAVGATGTQFEGRGVRITDTNNGTAQDAAATVIDLGFPIPIDCLATPSNGSLGSVCGVNTSANALAPGVVRAGDTAVWELGEIQVLDSDDRVLAVQGIYLP